MKLINFFFTVFAMYIRVKIRIFKEFFLKIYTGLISMAKNPQYGSIIINNYFF